MGKIYSFIVNLFIAEVITMIIILLFFPLISTLPWTGESVTIIHYLLHPQKIYSFDWGFLFDSFEILFLPFLLDVYLFFYLIRPQKEKITIKVVIEKIIIVAAMFLIPYIVYGVVSFIEGFLLI